MKKIIYCIGAFTFCKFSYQQSTTLYNYYYRPPLDLQDRYGLCYCLITSGCDQLSKEFAQSLADKGFNLILVDQNQKELEEIAQQLQNQHQVKIETISFDFMNASTWNYEKLFSDLENYDIGVLINNAGVMNQAGFKQETPGNLLKQLKCNTIPLTFFGHHFLKKFKKRNKKSALINISSQKGSFPDGDYPGYCASQSFANIFTQSLQTEMKGCNKIDIGLCLPGPMMNHESRNSANNQIEERFVEKYFQVDPKEIADSSIRQFGQDGVIYGPFKHKILHGFYRNFGSLLEWYHKGVMQNWYL